MTGYTLARDIADYYATHATPREMADAILDADAEEDRPPRVTPPTPLWFVCSHCRGSGRALSYTGPCPECNGTGGEWRRIR